MNNFIFENATKTYFGKGCVKEYLTCLSKHYGKNVMLAYGEGSMKENGIYEEIMKSLTKAGKNVVEFSDITSNPTYAKVLEGAKLARENQIDFILAAGGESVMDCCKAVSMATVYEGDLWKDFFARPGIMEFEPIPLGVITTAGAGSEMNGGMVITNEALKIKTGRDYPKCNPEFALIDPAYTFDESLKKTAASGFDTLSRIMEMYFCKPDENNVSDDLAEALMRSVIQNLRAVMQTPLDYTARSNLMWAATMAENRIIKLGKQADYQCREMKNQLDAYTGCNHSERLAVIHPVYFRHIYQDGLAKFQRFAVNVWEIPAAGKSVKELARAGIEALENFAHEIGMPASLREMDIRESIDLRAVADSCRLLPGSYKKMTHSEILEILQECYETE